jgi:hypothetical protein
MSIKLNDQSRLSRRTIARRRFVPRLEALEDRSVPAGVVNAVLAGSVLTITAVNDANDVNINNTNHQNITLDGAGTNNITITANSGETGTAISGGPFLGVTSIKLNMGLGNDTVIITDTILNGAVTFLGGSGNNSLFIDGAGNISTYAGGSPGNVIIGALNITNGAGTNSFVAAGGNHLISGNVVIRNGQGLSVTAFGNAVSDVTNVGGTIKIFNADGINHFRTAGSSATFSGAIAINNGNGDSTTYFDATTNSLTGGITVINGAGFDEFRSTSNSFTVGTPVARRHLTINNGNGGSVNSLDATTNTIHGNIAVSATAGADNFDVDGNNFTVAGAVRISTGNGGGTTIISPSQVVDIGGAVVVIAGEGDDELSFDALSVDVGSVSFSSGNGLSDLNLDGGGTTIAGSINHSNGTGGSNTFFDSTVHNIGGAVISTHGSGVDDFNVSGTSFSVTGAVAIRNGIGGSTTTIDANGSNSIGGKLIVSAADGIDVMQFVRLTVTGATSIATGNGDDQIALHDSTFDGALTINSGAGIDILFIETGAFDNGVSTTFNGVVRIISGNGDDQVLIGAIADADDVGEFNSAVTIIGGLDLDIVRAEVNTNNDFTVAPIISGFEQGT